nr:epdl2 protein [Gymnarchus niloticus]
MQLLGLLPLCLCLLAVNEGAKTPHPCKSPPLMVGRLSYVNPKGETVVYERFSYDALARRIRIRAAVTVGNQTIFEDLLLLYQEGVMYEISYRNETCKKIALKTPFQPIEIPSNAHLMGEVILGSSSAPGMGLLVNVWDGTVPELKANYQLAFTEFGCLPVSYVYHTKETGMEFASFYDFVLGIEDPNEFIPPPFCNKAELRQTGGEKVHDFFRFLGK